MKIVSDRKADKIKSKDSNAYASIPNNRHPNSNNPNSYVDIDSYYTMFRDAPCPLTYRMGTCLLKLCKIEEKQVVLSGSGWCHYCNKAMHNDEYQDSTHPDFNEEECT